MKSEGIVRYTEKSLKIFKSGKMLFLQSPKFKALFISGRQLQKQRE